MRTFIFIIWFYPQSKTCSLFYQLSDIWNPAASAEFKHANWSSWFHKNPNAYNHTHFWISRYCWVTKFVCPFLYFWIRNVAGVGRQANGHTRFIDSSLCSAGRVLLFIPKHTEGHQDTQIFIPKHTGGHQKYLVARLQNMLFRNSLEFSRLSDHGSLTLLHLPFENPN